MRTRREVLKAGAGLGITLLLAACGQSGSPAAGSAAPKTSAPAAGASLTGSAAASATAAAGAAAAVDISKPVAPKVATLEAELALPDAVLQGAKKEGKFTWTSSIDKDVAKTVMDAFMKRYPDVQPQYQEGSEETRTVRTLTEFKAGRNKLDVAMGLGGFLGEYKAANALSKLTDLPAYANYDPPFRDTQSEWGGVRSQYWSIGYNTDKVKDDELPKTWDDLTDPKWKGRIGLGDRPQLWAEHLWKQWGADRTTEFLKKLFANGVQRRKEGLDAAAQLLGAGEFDLYVPSAPYRIEGLVKKKTPVGWWSPDMLPVSFSDITILNNIPNPNSAKVFVNWFLSREGQDVYCKADFAAPTHPALRLDKQYLGIFADRLLSRKWINVAPDEELAILPDVRKVWQALWVA